MNGRYSPARTLVAGSRRGRSRLQGILALILAIALGVSLFIGLPAIRYRNEAEQFFALRMLTECDAAVSQLTRLSRTASVNSYSVLAEIRSRIRSAQILNETSSALGGRQLVPESAFETVYDTLDSYNNNLLVGAMTANLQTELTDTLNGLRDTIAAAQ